MTSEAAKDSGPLSSIEAPVMGILSKVPLSQVPMWGKAYFQPMETFAANRKDANFGPVAINLMLIGMVAWASFSIASVISSGLSLSTGAALAVLLVLFPISMVIGMFISSGITFVLAKVFGGKGGFMEQTLALTLVYGGFTVLAFPFQALSSVPILGFILGLVTFAIGLYNLYNHYLIIKGVHSLTTWKAIAVVAIPIIIALVAMVIFLAIFAAIIGGLIGGAIMAKGMGAFPPAM